MNTAMKTLCTRACACAWLALLGVLAAPAHAQITCEAASPSMSVNFGNYQSGQSSAVTAASLGVWRFSCKSTLSVPRNVQICLGLGSGSMGTLDGMRRMRNAAGDSLRYELYSDPALTQAYGLIPDGIAATATVPANGNVGIVTPFRINGWMPGGQAAPPGSYISHFDSGQIQIRYRPYAGSTPPTCTTGGTAMTPPYFTVRAQVRNFCEIMQVEHVDFGTHTASAVTGGINGGGKLLVRCTPNTVYSIALGNGQHAQGSQRRMRHVDGSANVLAYELYRDTNLTERWGSIPQERQHGTATGSMEEYKIYAQVPAGQTVTAVGAYKDTVVVTVAY